MSDYDVACRRFADAGLPAPPVPAPLRRTFRQRGDWVYSSRDLGEWSMYAVGEFIEEALSNPEREYVAVGHAGHGINSYAMHYFLVYGPVALFAQLPWGGAYMDPTETARVIQERFVDFGHLIAAVEQLETSDWDPHRILLCVDIPWSSRWSAQWMDLHDESTSGEIAPDSISAPPSQRPSPRPRRRPLRRQAPTMSPARTAIGLLHDTPASDGR